MKALEDLQNNTLNKEVIMENIIETKLNIDNYGIYVVITTKDGSTFSLDDLDDELLIITLKKKGYKITREF